MKNLFRKIGNIIESTILCIRFPFLYPRNAYNGKHYTNIVIENYRGKLLRKYKSRSKDLNDKSKVYHVKYYPIIGEYAYYNTWWSYYYIKFIDLVHSFICIFHIIPTYNYLYWMPEGWRKAFGIQMCKDIKKALLKKGKEYLRDYRILQIKEKYGSLRWYDNGSTVEVSKIIDKYAYISERTCIICGELADVYTPLEYWKCPYCDKHAPTNSSYLLDYGITTPYIKDKETKYGLEWYGYSGNINFRPDYKERQEKFQEYLNL